VPIDAAQILSDSAFGSLLFGTILCASLGVLSLIDFLRSLKLLERINDAIAGQQEAAGDQDRQVVVPDQAQAVVPDQIVAPAIDQVPVPAPQNANRDNAIGFEDALFGLLEARNAQNEEIEADDAPQAFDLEEMAGVKGPLLGFLWHILSIILFNSVVLATFVLVPIVAGKLFSRVGTHALIPDRKDTEKDSSTTSLLIGYFVIIASSIFYICALFVKQKFCELGAFEKQIAGFVIFMFTTLKVAVLFVCEIILFPIFCANLINFFTLPLFPTTWDQRREMILEHPIFSTCVLWAIGFLFVLGFSVIIKNLRAMLRPEVLWFLRNPDDPSFSLLRDMVKEPLIQHGKRFVSSGILYALLVILCVAAPIRLSLYIFPKLTPLRAVSGIYVVPFDILLFHVVIPFTAKLFSPFRGLAHLTALWLCSVAYFLDLNEYFFGRMRENGVPERFYNANVEEDNEPRQPGNAEVYKPVGFGWRIALVLCVAWVSVLLMSLLLVTVPLVVGRKALTYLTTVGDLYALVLGFYLTWGTGALITYAVNSAIGGTEISITQNIQKMKQISGKILSLVVLLLLWFGLLPVLVGYWFQNVYITPFKVEFNQTPAQIPKYTFAIGTLYLNLWCRLVMINGVLDSWRIKFEKVRDDGFERLDFDYVLGQIISPIFHTAMVSLCVPYVFHRAIVFYFDFDSLTNLQIERYCYLIFSVLLMVYSGLEQAIEWLIGLHSQIRDDKYLIGQFLENVETAEPETLNSQRNFEQL